MNASELENEAPSRALFIHRNCDEHGGCYSCCAQLYLELIWQNWLDQISSHVTHPSIWIEDEPCPCGMHGCPQWRTQDLNLGYA